MKKIYIYIYALALAFAVIFNSSCSEHEVCHSECSIREDSCNDRCDKEFPLGSPERHNCYNLCSNTYIKCIQKCEGISD